MSEHPILFVGNRSPSITETITHDDGTPVDLTASTVRFKMRAPDSSTLKVDQPAVIVSAPAGTVRYDWASVDVDTAGHYLIWWEVTTGTKTQDLNEAIVEFRAHAPVARSYLELEEFKSTAELSGTTFADKDISEALAAASRGIEEMVGRRFYADPDVNQVRYYSRSDIEENDSFILGRGLGYLDAYDWSRRHWHETLRIDDLVTLTTLQTDDDGDGTFESTWTLGTDFVLEPKNAPADGKPYNEIRVLRNGRFRLPPYEDAIKVTGQFGWAAIPEEIKMATKLIATRLLLRVRQAPLGVVSFGLDNMAVRAASLARDSDIAFLLERHMRRKLLV